MTSIGVIFKRALWDARFGILGWGIGLGLLAFGEVTLFPTITVAYTGIAEMFENPVYRALLGEAADAAAFATPQGYLSIYMLALVPLYLAVYMVILGLGVVSNDEERGRLDLLLGTPIPRWQVIVEKFAVVIVVLLLVLLLNSLGAAMGVLVTPEMQGLSLARLAEATLGMLPVSLLMAALVLFLASMLRSRMVAIGVTAAIIIASYFVNNLALVAQDALGTVKLLSFFNYFSPLDTMRTGIIWSEFVLLLGVTLLLVALALAAFQRRDLAL